MPKPPAHPSLTDLSPFMPGVIFSFRVNAFLDGSLPHWVITGFRLETDSSVLRTLNGKVDVMMRVCTMTASCLPVRPDSIADVAYEIGNDGDSIHQMSSGDFWGMRHHDKCDAGIDIVYDWVPPKEWPRWKKTVVIYR
jgi:hypothetical protein